MPHPWDNGTFQHYDWLPWKQATAANLPEILGAYLSQINTLLGELNITVSSEPGGQTFNFFLNYGDDKVAINAEEIVPPAMLQYLDTVNDLPKLQKICECIDKMPLNDTEKKQMLDLTMFSHHLLGMDAGNIQKGDILKCLQSPTIIGSVRDGGKKSADLQAFLEKHFTDLQQMFVTMQVEPRELATPHVILTHARTGVGLTSKVEAIKSVYDAEGIQAETYDVGTSPDMQVLQVAFSAPFVDQASAWNIKAAKDTDQGNNEFGKMLLLERYVGAMLGVPRFLQIARQKFWSEDVTHLVSATNFKPSVFIGALGPALGIPVALFATNHLVPDAVKIAAESMPPDANVTAYIQDPEDLVQRSEDHYEILSCPIDPAFKKLDRDEVLKQTKGDLDHYHGVVGISLGGVAHINIISQMLDHVPANKQYVIALGNSATDEVKTTLNAKAQERGINIKFADECFGETGKKLSPAQMNVFYNACDLVIAKPGGSTVAELPALGTPAVFITVGAHNFMEKPNLEYLLKKYPDHYKAVESIGELSTLQIGQKFAAQVDWQEPIREFARGSTRQPHTAVKI